MKTRITIVMTVEGEPEEVYSAVDVACDLRLVQDAIEAVAQDICDLKIVETIVINGGPIS